MVSLSLANVNYAISVIGYTWDPNTTFSIENTSISIEGWNIANIIAILFCIGFTNVIVVKNFIILDK